LISLATVAFGTIIGSYVLYKAIASVSLISGDPLGNGLRWLTGWVVTDIIITIGLILAVVALIRGGRRGLAGIALAVGALIAPLAFFGAVQLGADVVQERARTQLAGAADQAGLSLVEYADQQGIDLGPFRPVLDRLLADDR